MIWRGFLKALAPKRFALFAAFYCEFRVKPEFRGKGYGLSIWRAGMAHLESCNIGLEGFVAQQDNYKTSGFRLAYRNIRFKSLARVLAKKPEQTVTLQAVSCGLAGHADPGANVYLDIPETNPEAVCLTKQYCMEKVLETARMYTQEFSAPAINQIFGVTTFELG